MIDDEMESIDTRNDYRLPQLHSGSAYFSEEFIKSWRQYPVEHFVFVCSEIAKQDDRKYETEAECGMDQP